MYVCQYKTFNSTGNNFLEKFRRFNTRHFFLIFLLYILLSLLYFKNRHWEIEYKTNYKNDISFQLEIKTSRIIILVNEVISRYSFMNQNDWSFQSTIHVQYSSVIKNMSIFFKFSNECVCLKENFIPI